MRRIVMALCLLAPTAAGATLPDTDGDGYPDSIDCAPEDASIHPRAEEIPYDGIDQNCSGSDLCDDDLDGVNAEECGGADCDDTNADIGPNATDIPGDGIDQDCDGADAEGACDNDGDGFLALHCGGDDCNDADGRVNPDAEDIYGDGIDQDCDGVDACEPVPWVQGGMCSSVGPVTGAWWLALVLPVFLRRRR